MGTLAASILAGAGAGVFAVLMLFQRSLYASAICLLAVLLQASALFYLSGSPLLAFLQLMIHAGAVMVLVVITIVASPTPVERRWAVSGLPRPLLLTGAALPAALAALFLSRAQPGAAMAAGAALGPAQAAIGSVLFGPYALATEAVGLLLFLSALAVVDFK